MKNPKEFKPIFSRDYYMNSSNAFIYDKPRLVKSLKGFTGILAIIYIEEAFPFEPAVEYVNTRPCIFLCKVINGSYNMSELFKYISLVQTNDIELWLTENCSFCLYDMERDVLRLKWRSILQEFSPIFNIKNNPGNLFQYTLESLEKDDPKIIATEIKEPLDRNAFPFAKDA